MNRGRHKKIYPKEIYKLDNIKAFTKVFTPKQAKALINNIKEQSPDGKINILAWENDPFSTTNKKGFIWYTSPEGENYWANLIRKYVKYKNYKK